MIVEGPPTINETRKDFQSLQSTFPNAIIRASNFSNFVEEVLSSPKATENLFNFTAEIGDTWIYGVASDPYRVAAFRSIMRDRTNCLNAKECEFVAYFVFWINFCTPGNVERFF